MSTISSFIQQRLADIQSSVAHRIETNDVLLDMVAVIEEFHEAEERKKHIQDIETANNKNAALQKEIECLRQEKKDSDAELLRIKMEAEAVRDSLIHDVGYILYESKSIQKHKERIHELENRVLELSQQRPIMTVIQASPSSSSISSPLPPTPPDNVSSHLLITADTNEPPSTPMHIPLSVRTQSPVPSNDIVSHSTTIKESNGNSDVIHPVVELCAAENDRPSHLLRLDNRILHVLTLFLSRKDTMQIARSNRSLFVRLNVLMGMESKIVTTNWNVHDITEKNMKEGLSDQKQLPPPSVIVAATTPAAQTASSSTTKSKFSMLFAAAADNVLPSSLTASMMTVVGAVGMGGRDRSSSGSSTKPPPSTSSGPSNSPMPLLSPGVAYSPLRGDLTGVGIAGTGIAGTGFTAVGNGGQGSGQGHYNDMFSKEMADSLAKKLSSAEMRAVIHMTETFKTKSSQLEIVTAENEDLTSRLQGILTMRDFLIEKLKSAEIALKAVMIENAAFRKQTSADQEVINYLDLRGQDLDCHNTELSARVEQLQAAYNLQCGAHSYTEHQLQMDLEQYKTKCEDMERTFHTDKTILVKEVKRLRNQLDKVGKEKEKNAQQLSALKRILHLDNP